MKTFFPIVVALMLASALLADGEAARIQAAFFDTASVTLSPDGADSLAEAQADGVQDAVLPPVSLQKFPEAYMCGIAVSGWNWGLWLTALSLVFLCMDGVVAWWRFRQSPRQCRLREARRALRAFIRGNGSLEGAVDALRMRLELPEGTSLTGLADAVQRDNRELAEACRELERQRWSGDGNHGATAVARLRKALRALALAAVWLVVGGCLGIGFWGEFSDWGHGVKLAADGKPLEALEVFLELEGRLPSSPELSRNIAVLLTVLPTDGEAGMAALSVPVRQCHALTLQALFEPFGPGDWRNHIPAMALAACMPLLAAAVSLAWHRRKSMAAVVAAAGLAALVLAGLQLARACRLEHAAVASDGADILLTPDTGGECLKRLEDPNVVALDRSCPRVNGFCRVTCGEVTGWVAEGQLLEFRLTVAAKD